MVRIKNRYLLVNILYPSDITPIPTTAGTTSNIVKLHQPSPETLTHQSLLKAIRSKISELFGDYGAGSTAGSLTLKYLSQATSTFILKVSRDHYRLVWAALTFMHEIPNGKHCVYRVVRCSGTIRKAEEEAIRLAKEIMLRARQEAGEHTEAALKALFGGTDTAADTLRDVTMGGMSDTDESESEAEGNLR